MYNANSLFTFAVQSSTANGKWVAMERTNLCIQTSLWVWVWVCVRLKDNIISLNPVFVEHLFSETKLFAANNKAHWPCIFKHGEYQIISQTTTFPSTDQRVLPRSSVSLAFGYFFKRCCCCSRD